jgi:hypothetical protein
MGKSLEHRCLRLMLSKLNLGAFAPVEVQFSEYRYWGIASEIAARVKVTLGDSVIY